MSIAFVAGASAVWIGDGTVDALSPSFTPGAGNTVITYGAIWNAGVTPVRFTGSVDTYTVLSGIGQFDDLEGDAMALAYRLSATASSQTISTGSTPSTAPTVRYGHWVQYSGVGSIGSDAATNVATPGTGAGAIAGAAVTVPTGSVLVAYCVTQDNSTAAMTAAGGGTTDATTNEDDGLGHVNNVAVGHWVGAGASITPTFTTDAGGDNYQVLQFILTPPGGSTTNKTLSVTTAVSLALIKQPRKTLAVTSGTTTVLIKQPRKTFAVTTSATPVLVRRISKTLAYTTAAAVGFAEGLLLKMTKAVTTAATVGFSQKQIATQLFSVTTAATVGVVKSIGKVLVAAISGATVGLTKSITKVPFTVTTAATVSLTEQLSLHKTLGVLAAITVGFSLTKVKQLVFSITTAVSLAFTATFIPATVITLTAGRKVIRQLFNFLARR